MFNKIPFIIIKDYILSFENDLSIVDRICFSLRPEEDHQHDYNQSINIDYNNLNLPKYTTKLVFYSSGSWPSSFADCTNLVSIKLLYSGVDLKRFLWTSDKFPPTLEILNVMTSFNSVIPIGSLPASLKEFRLGMSFNQPLEVGVFPPGIRLISLYCDSFNQPIPAGLFPDSVTSLRFGAEFNQPLGSSQLPPNLKRLMLGRSFRHKLNYLPPTLTYLDISLNIINFDWLGVDGSNLPDFSQTPKLVTIGKFPYQFKHLLPPSVTDLTLIDLFRKTSVNGNPKVSLLNNVRELTIGDNFDIKFNKNSFPKALKILNIGFYYHQIDPFVLPESLQVFNITEYSFSIEKDLLPKKLEELRVSLHTEKLKVQAGSLPASLKLLIFGGYYNGKLIIGDSY
ncbi:hypothetical protein PPL_10381 [Heterostelium album PN500]|uniref:FNIP repeat-containing protein n=1 Tax=Heterostelium pallidum (strain ATCC 26659 / Pp 5 / PN500) TaxID=670386 RepID=D3BQX8_HETP5|nr:hypothetical protein PPL_10381 [Heterostelium album PN500]EFA76164.1 hypothetical protein PPL_10381 [Heterostelium album PN500]|eukprot:XP_020428298.1 hypothetical protein PPL_10381 [Heterostelium album PN500]